MDFVGEILKKYPYLDNETATRIVNQAKYFYYNLAYPTDSSVDEESKPIKGFRNEQWVILACEEIIERAGVSSAIGYRENGMSWSFDNAHISSFLASQITPNAGVIK